MNEYLTFRKMITPVFIQVIFWIAVVGIVIAAIAMMANDSVGGGLALLIFGPLGARIYAEILMVIFRINDNVAALRGAKQAPSPGADLT